jgi:two-component system chemotaxis response regulator CheY
MTAAQPSKNVLIIDDSAVLRASLRHELGRHGLTVYEATQGKEALAQLAALEARGERLALIITDINMPVMDGIAFITAAKQTNSRYVPILVLTTESQEERKLAGKAAGAAGWLVKPFTPETMQAVIKKFVR